MRKFFVILLLVYFTAPAFSQPLDTITTRTVEDYLKSSKRQKTMGLVLTTAGATGLISTLVVDATRSVGGAFVTFLSLGTVQPEPKSYSTYYLVSTVVTIGGLVYLISAGENKKRARALQTSFKMESTPVLLPTGMGQQNYPSISLSLRL